MKRECVYCQAVTECESEHVVPKSWYPTSTPVHIQRLTVPSCGPCNDRWERTEVALARELLFLISPDAAEVAGVHDRLLRSMNAAHGKTPREQRARAALAQKVLATMVWTEPAPGKAQATVRTPGGVYARASPARTIDPDAVKQIAEKFIRGLHHDATGEILREVRVRRAFVVTSELRADPELALLWQGLQAIPIDESLGPGFWSRRYVVDAQKTFWAFLLWGQITIVALAELHR